MSLLDYTDKIRAKEVQKRTDYEIYKYIADKRILRVLFENRIFELRDIQKQAIKKGLFFRNSFLICSPSGSGKTLIGEICAVNNIFQDYGKSIYLVPFKALATEKYYYFKKSYERFGINVELSIGDYDIEDSKLQKASIIVTTYEKLDSILRNFIDSAWISEISTIIVDEVHIIGESDRGPRLESLIVRLNEFLHNPQLIFLSATIANAEFFNSWLNSLGNNTILIKSDNRPVPLHYKIEIAQNKDTVIKRLVKKSLKNKGQVLIFVNQRRSTHQVAQNLKEIINTELNEAEQKICKALKKQLKLIKGGNRELQNVIEYGIAFHHAGLLPKERKLVEDNFRKRIIKVISCTTTLSAGINTPARMVILKDFKKYVTSGHNITNYQNYYENFTDGFSYFKPFSANEVFQILGRAGRPGLDNVGYGIILVSQLEEQHWVEDHYFHNHALDNKLIPKYNNLISGLNKINTLKEQTLLRIYEEKKITMASLKQFFERTYFWYGIRQKMKQDNIPVEQLLMIKEITPHNILKLHSDPDRLKNLRENKSQMRISKLTESTIGGYIKTDYGVYYCQFDIEIGIQCSCGFKNGVSDNFIDDKFSFSFCDHVSMFLMFLIRFPDIKVRKYINDIIPKSIKNQYILNYLFEKGLIIKNKDGTIKCSQFGQMIIRLYLYPVSGVLIRYKLENKEINTFQDLINEAYDVLKAEYRIKGDKMLDPLKEWCDEEPIEKILDKYNIMTGDLFSVRDNLERIVYFIGRVARDLKTNGADVREKMNNISEMAETLKIRIKYGIKEELFDLVLRLKDVARVRARMLYNAGYHTATQVKREDPYILNHKTRLGINLCKRILS